MADVRCEIEEGIIAWALTDTEHVPMVAEEDHELFTKPHTRHIHMAIQMLYAEGEPVSYRTIQGKLAANGLTAELGGILAAKTGGHGECKTLIGQLRDIEFQQQRRDLGTYLMKTADPYPVVEKAVQAVFQTKGRRTAVDIGDEADLDEHYGTVRAQRTGLDILDENGGLFDGEMCVVAARPGVGKSMLALNIALNFLRQQSPVYLITREMLRKEVQTRLLSGMTGIGYHQIMRRMLTPTEREKVQKTWDWMREKWKGLLYIDDRLTKIADLRPAVRGCGCRMKMGLVIIDYMGLMEADGKSDYERVTKISREIKKFSQDFQVPTLALAQLNREVDKRKSPEPILSDLRDSGAIEQDANIITFLWQTEYGEMYLTKAKDRNGKPGKQQIWMRKDLFRVSNGRDIMVAP